MSTQRIDELSAIAFEHGALGCKISGAGGGGFIMFIVPPEQRVPIVRSLNGSGGMASGVQFTSFGAEILDHAEQEFIASYLSDSGNVLKAYAADATARSMLIGFADIITTALTSRKKLMIAGNGGSAADAQHIAGEFVSRLFADRAPLSAIALTTDSPS